MTAALTEQEQLLRAVLLNPADDTVRLAYADWLQENGEPERAEFIRTSIHHRESENGYTLQPHVHHKMLRMFDVPSLPSDRFLYRRGFVDEIRLSLQAFLDHAKDLFSHHPITKVVLTDYQVRYNDVVYPNFLYLSERILDTLPAHYVELINAISEPQMTQLEQSDICVRFGRKWAGLTE